MVAISITQTHAVRIHDTVNTSFVFKINPSVEPFVMLFHLNML